MDSRNIRAPLAALGCLLTIACSTASGGSDEQVADSPAARDAASGAEAGGMITTAEGGFSGGCSAGKWGSTSDACWGCLCTQCAGELDQCGPDCLDVLQCTVEKHALVGVPDDVACEVRATVGLCLTDPKSQAAATAVVNLDTCLIAKAAQAGDGHFRACESECSITYSGDVCERFPN